MKIPPCCGTTGTPIGVIIPLMMIPINSITNKDNEDNLEKLVKGIRIKYKESYTEIYILYLGNEAKKLMGTLSNVEEYFLYHPACKNKNSISSWINYDDENSGKIKDKFRMV